MPITFNVIERGQPGVSGGGVKKFYASPKMVGESTLKDLATNIEKQSNVSSEDIRSVLDTLVDVIQDKLADGQIIRLGELGSLRVSFSSESRDTAEEINTTCIKKARILFSPGKGIKDTLTTLNYQKNK